MRSLVIYRSISGFTKKYAEWIAQELKAEIHSAKKFDVALFSNYDLVIFGGSLHAVGINGIKIVKQNLPILKNKKIIVFCVGASPSREYILGEIKNKNLTAEQQQNISFYYLRGGFNYNKLDRIDKVIMSLFKVRIAMKKKLTSDEISMLAAYAKPITLHQKRKHYTNC